ncbi:MAG: hypothetical protein B193_2102 [Solidesulfovibrio magneticus str. Maddingley MBC34]|uniref:TPM domain-containing protein n=1 Tax=Solidesulfovibrio magneticus str. Maddingley MBC34 TaxID=1206767 RepID=K6GDM7_9BACT|nr:MAG: hypothetical protein B193_2102 [Solidesulfovibrio magneticus str. Maddingley MBC34]
MKRLFFVPRGRSTSERLARGLLLAGVFALAVVAYQRNFERVIARTEARGVVADPAGVLSREDRLWLLEAAEHLRGRFGLELAVRLGTDIPPPTLNNPKKIVVYAAPDCAGSRVVLPPLAAAGLPAGLPADLAREHLDAACRAGKPREGLLATVGLLVSALDEAADKAKGDDT